MKNKNSPAPEPGMLPMVWSIEELEEESLISIGRFRKERLAEGDGEWKEHVKAAHAKFTALFAHVSALSPGGISGDMLAKVYGDNLGESLRYLAGPPISADDLKILGDVKSAAARVLKDNPVEGRKVFAVIERIIDSRRFPWVAEKRNPTEAEVEAALLASSVLLAAQRIATKRRNAGKTD